MLYNLHIDFKEWVKCDAHVGVDKQWCILDLQE